MRLFLVFIFALSCQEVEDVHTPSVKVGEELYTRYCLRCHGTQGNGGKIAPFLLIERGIIENEAQFLDVVKNGKFGSMMKGFDGLLGENQMKSLRLQLREWQRESKENSKRK